MANAERHVKAAADKVTENGCMDGGVAEVIEKFILRS
jgi:hydroxymethylpyrimidine pyrophosphatase-like HAD family hydrolase